MPQKPSHGSSIELVVLGLLAALIVVLAVPLVDGAPQTSTKETASIASESKIADPS